MNARERLEAIAARADGATPGPWKQSNATARRVVEDWPPPQAAIAPICDANMEFDAAFIAHARTDVPALVEFATAVLDWCDDVSPMGWDHTQGYVSDVRRLADEHLGGTS